MTISEADYRHKKVLIFPFGLLSHYIRMMVFAQRYLSDAQVVFVGDGGYQYQKLVEEHGFEYVKCASLNPNVVMPLANRFDFSWLNRFMLEPIYQAQVELIKASQADIVIGDFCPTLKMAAEKCSVPFHSVMNGYLSPYYNGTRRVPQRHFANTIFKVFPLRLSDAVTRSMEKKKMKRLSRTFNRIRKKHGLAKSKGYLQEYEGDLNYICDDPAIFPQQGLPQNWKFIKPLVPLAKEGCEEKNYDVVISMGSSGDWSNLTFLTSKAYSELKMIAIGDVSQVLSCPHIDSVTFGDMHQFIRNTKLLICHGGNGTIQFGLKYKVPMLFLTSHFEQEWNAGRMEELGYGTWVKGKHAIQVTQTMQLLKLI